MKINVAVFFGGRSVEHEISVISAVQAINYFDEQKYRVFPIYITKDNRFFYSEAYKDIATFRDLDAAERLGVPVAFETSKTHYGTPKTHLVAPQAKRSQREIGIIDVVLPVTHGTFVEDGTIAGLLELYNLPYAGSNVFSSALCMDKWASKLALQTAGVPVLPGVKVSSSLSQSEREQMLHSAGISFPVIVKPVNLGSSVGISLANNPTELAEAFELAFTFAKHVLVEPAVQNLREVNCSVLGDEDVQNVSSIEEVFKQDAILSFDDKYLTSSEASSGSKGSKLTSSGAKSGSKSATFLGARETKSGTAGKLDGGSKSGMASLARRVPADVSLDLRQEVQDIAARAFKELRCHGVARLDFLIDTATGKVYLNEVNTIPGSLAFYLWEASGVKYPEMLERLVSLAFKRQRDLEDTVFSFETNVLAQAAV